MNAPLRTFDGIRDRFAVLILTFVHEKSKCANVAEVVDIRKIPAFLYRQTILTLAAARTEKSFLH